MHDARLHGTCTFRYQYKTMQRAGRCTSWKSKDWSDRRGQTMMQDMQRTKKRGRSRMDLNTTYSCTCLGNLAQPGSSGVRFGSGKKAQMLRQSGFPPVSHGAVPRRPCSHTRSVMPAHARSRRRESKHMAERPASEPQD